MKLTAMTLVMAAAAGAHMKVPQTSDGHMLTAYLVDRRSSHDSQLGNAEQMAVEMFATVGVRLQWRHHAPAVGPAPADMAVVVELIEGAPADQKPGVLAYAREYEGIHLTIFYDRVKALDPVWPTAVLAHVMVHEITHLLQGVCRHSETGVMKPKFNRADVVAMRRATLGFAEEDRLFIDLGIARRTGVAAEMAAPSAEQGLSAAH